MAEATDQTIAIQPAGKTEQTIAVQPVGKTEQTVAIRPTEQSEQTMPVRIEAAAPVETEQTVKIGSAELEQRLAAVGMARVAIQGKAAVKAIEAAPVKRETPTLPAGFEDLGVTWWCAVAKVHEALLSEDELRTVCEAFDAELRARWEYAKSLHEEGYAVPEYLTEHAPVAPLWPLPPLPEKAGELAHAA